MSGLRLMKPLKDHEDEANAFKGEFMEYGEKIINGSVLFDKTDSYNLWLARLKENSSADTVQSGWVISSTFFAFLEDRIIGIIDIRHSLNNFLSQYGGHIGYSIRPSERGKGYATQMLKLGLEHCREIGLSEVMLGCYKDNTASIRTIERNGGLLRRELDYTDGKPMLVYWITL